jgi:hypothetical protein
MPNRPLNRARYLFPGELPLSLEVIGSPLQYGPLPEQEPIGWSERKGFAEMVGIARNTDGTLEINSSEMISGSEEIVSDEIPLQDPAIEIGLDVRTMAELGLLGAAGLYAYRRFRGRAPSQALVPNLTSPGGSTVESVPLPQEIPGDGGASSYGPAPPPPPGYAPASSLVASPMAAPLLSPYRPPPGALLQSIPVTIPNPEYAKAAPAFALSAATKARQTRSAVLPGQVTVDLTTVPGLQAEIARLTVEKSKTADPTVQFYIQSDINAAKRKIDALYALLAVTSTPATPATPTASRPNPNPAPDTWSASSKGSARFSLTTRGMSMGGALGQVIAAPVVVVASVASEAARVLGNLAFALSGKEKNRKPPFGEW